MSRSFRRLQRVLDLEAKQGYQNKAVVGGIRQFAVYWVEQARGETVDEADKAFVEQMAETLMDYGRLPGAEARAKTIDALIESLKRRQDRVGDAESARPKRPPTPPRERPVPPTFDPPAPEPEPVPEPEAEAEVETETAVAEAPPSPSKKQTKRPSTPAKPSDMPQADPDPEGLQQSVTILKGVGPRIAERLARLGAETIWDLLYLFPRRYDDYSVMKPINRLQYGEQVTVIGTLWEARARRTRTNQVMVQAMLNDGSGQIQATWFNQPWVADKLKAGMQVVMRGKVEQYLGRPVFNSPEWEPIEMDSLRNNRIVPIYPLTEGLKAHKMRELMGKATGYWAARVPDPLPEPVRKRQKLYTLPQALYQTHLPDSPETLQAARHRLMFDELFLLQLGMQRQKRAWQAEPGIPLLADPAHLIRFRNALPFDLTGAQERVIEEIVQDMARNVPMNRLLQGDVGAGKTIVAAAAMMMAVKAEAQVALMAPTEILAEQHYQGLRKLLEPLEVTVCLLTGSTPESERVQILAGLASGQIQVAIGTHALIQEGVQFHKLALAVIDEQHRFGVDQRAALRDKGAEAENGRPNPHVLVMSATPIPRTLALSLYGDLDLSILDEMPPGRQEIKTRWLRGSERERAYGFVRRQVKEGRQAYVIYPLVEESDKIDEKAAVEEYARLQDEVFPDLKVGLIHGRLKSAEKEAVMRAFYNGETNILVATSVIEVGVDVPNSTIMLIEGANRFGLAQLHQFRGRVGRGEHQSYCILIAETGSAVAEERLQALEQTNDGFVLAEKDLEIRGPGQFFGRRQSGLPELKLASLLDMEMVTRAREEAEKIYKADPELEKDEHVLLREQVGRFWHDAADVS
ncbi:MAG: ATP-dependent DNA helicase RecG [Ardenticatenaceae bacterium]|nr:ATP-dependent DNA helicase RecG [Ardenticatenaceae bacterium]